MGEKNQNMKENEIQTMIAKKKSIAEYNTE